MPTDFHQYSEARLGFYSAVNTRGRARAGRIASAAERAPQVVHAVRDFPREKLYFWTAGVRYADLGISTEVTIRGCHCEDR